MQDFIAIITFSHLRWDFVLQRPQHLLSRLAKSHRIYFIEEPVISGSARLEWQFHEPHPNLVVCRPHTPCSAAGFHDDQLPYLRQLMRELVEQQQLQEYLLWFYTPMALPVAADLKPRAIVYDCMDELSGFLGAPPELLARERELLARANLVFTGGPSLYRAKNDLHPSVYCFPSSVDVSHFAPVADGRQDAEDQAALPHPRFGYYGVVDERMNLELLKAIADAHPEWQIVIVGPVVKIDPATLPRNPNIRYLGHRSYAELPAYLAGWDVCIMPFARNRATEFISPTKTLEFMAARKMIVSTPITDVAEPYGDIVYLGETTEEFIKACECALNASNEERAAREARMREVLNRTSWDSTVARMDDLITGVARSKHSGARTDVSALVVGAGPTGLSAAFHLGEDSLLLEQNSRVGGWCRSIEVAGFTFDYAGHIMFSGNPYVHQLYQMLLGDNVHWQDREAWIYSKNVYTRYPFQGSLYGLPSNVIKECIVGAIEARYGSLNRPKAAGKTNGHANGSNGTSASCKTELTDCCADGIMEAAVPLGQKQPTIAPLAEPANFEEFIYRVWGSGIARHFAIPYNQKLWAVPLREMETSWLGGRVPMPDLEEMIEGALSPAPKPMGPNARFGYPLRGGFQSLMDAWLPYLKGGLRTQIRVVRVHPSRHTVMLHDGSTVRYEHLISTMPLPVLIRQMGDEAPAAIRAAAAQLRHVSVRCVHIGVGREKLTEKHWIYYPEETVFHRIFVQGNASPYCNPPGGFGLTCEITHSPHKPLPCDGDDLVQRCIEDCRRVGLLAEDDPIWATAQCELPYAYVVYDHGRATAVRKIRDWLAEQGIILAGRYSEWEYYNSDHAFLAGKRAAEEVRKLRESHKNGAAGFYPEATLTSPERA
ncbi:MAG TPA: FAD-dependent oxidoreductase [Bryobacteraceae bacterium]|nr:FAD-dependent oxidoreductase [Bryobacteraceae bacterium]